MDTSAHGTPTIVNSCNFLSKRCLFFLMVMDGNSRIRKKIPRRLGPPENLTWGHRAIRFRNLFPFLIQKNHFLETLRIAENIWQRAYADPARFRQEGSLRRPEERISEGSLIFLVAPRMPKGPRPCVTRILRSDPTPLTRRIFWEGPTSLKWLHCKLYLQL